MAAVSAQAAPSCKEVQAQVQASKESSPFLGRVGDAKHCVGVEGGTLLGADFGEWGGGLWFVAGQTVHRYQFSNVEGIYLLGKEVLVLGGQRHMGANFGSLLRLEQSSSGPVVIASQRLRGAPRDIEQQGTDGELRFRIEQLDEQLRRVRDICYRVSASAAEPVEIDCRPAR